MRVIDLEAHFYTREYIEYLRARKEIPREDRDGDIIRMWFSDDVWAPQNSKLEDKLLDLGEGRLKDMDATRIDIQVISLTLPSIQLFDVSEGVAWARKVNDTLSKAAKGHPDRFIGLASVAPQSPEEAADEMERAVTELGLKGVVINSHARNEYLDNKRYWVIFERAEKLDVPIYLHPMIPPAAILRPYADYGFPLAGPAFGFAADATLHTMRLIYSGLFDRYPKLKIVLGHLGEGLPFWLSRLDYCFLGKWPGKKLIIERKPSEYIKTNFTITTSGMFSQPPFICSYLALGADRIAFAADYPYEDTEEALQFMKEAPICNSDKEKIYHLNAERLFKL